MVGRGPNQCPENVAFVAVRTYCIYYERNVKWNHSYCQCGNVHRSTASNCSILPATLTACHSTLEEVMADVTNASGAAPPESPAAIAAAAAAAPAKPSTAAKPSTSKKSLKAKKLVQPAEHPKYREMIASAIISLKERGGSSRQAILKHILAHYKVGSETNKVNGRVKVALRAGIQSGSLQQAKGTGASGSFRLGEKAKSAKPKPAKAAAGKPSLLKKAKAKATAVPKKVAAGKKVAVTAKKPKSATPKKLKLKGKSAKKGALAKKPKAKTPAKKAAKPKVVKKTPTKKQSKAKLSKK